MRRLLRFVTIATLLFVVLPLAAGTVTGYARGWPQSWRAANWESAGLLPAAEADREAQVMILAARTGRWRGIFAEHTWIVLKPQGARHWTRYEVMGWGNPVRRDGQPADGNWYGNRPYVVERISGDAARHLIPEIEAVIARYPYAARGSYKVWPGPNSNSFVAWVVRAVPGFDAELPAVAIGKDWLGPGLGIARAASGTGIVISLAGWFGITLALREGLEINIAGTGIGIDPEDLAIKLPAFGTLGFGGT